MSTFGHALARREDPDWVSLKIDPIRSSHHKLRVHDVINLERFRTCSLAPRRRLSHPKITAQTAYRPRCEESQSVPTFVGVSRSTQRRKARRSQRNHLRVPPNKPSRRLPIGDHSLRFAHGVVRDSTGALGVGPFPWRSGSRCVFYGPLVWRQKQREISATLEVASLILDVFAWS